MAPNGHKCCHKEAITLIESGLGWHLVWVDSIPPGRVPAFGSRAEGTPTWKMSGSCDQRVAGTRPVRETDNDEERSCRSGLMGRFTNVSSLRRGEPRQFLASNHAGSGGAMRRRWQGCLTPTTSGNGNHNRSRWWRGDRCNCRECWDGCCDWRGCWAHWWPSGRPIQEIKGACLPRRIYRGAAIPIAERKRSN